MNRKARIIAAKAAALAITEVLEQDLEEYGFSGKSFILKRSLLIAPLLKWDYRNYEIFIVDEIGEINEDNIKTAEVFEQDLKPISFTAKVNYKYNFIEIQCIKTRLKKTVPIMNHYDMWNIIEEIEKQRTRENFSNRKFLDH
jgi:hypothetical protein